MIPKSRGCRVEVVFAVFSDVLGLEVWFSACTYTNQSYVALAIANSTLYSTLREEIMASQFVNRNLDVLQVLH